MPARRRSWFLYTLLFVFVLGMSAVRWRLPAYAATFEVTSTNDSGTGTLRAAIESANTTPGADTITFDLPTGSEINLTNPLPLVVDTLTIDGGGRDITISPPVGRALVITQGDVVIQDVTFARGGAAIRHESSGTLGIDNVRFENLVGGDGSAVLVTTSSVSLNDVTVSGISGAGSAIQIRGDATVSAVSNLVIEGNRLSNAALLFDTTAAGTIVLDGVAVRANEGAAQVRVQAGDVALTNSVITGGVNATHGLRVNSGGTATLSFVTITGNGGNGISNAGTVNAQNTASAGNTNPGCTGGGTFSLTGRNFIDGSGCGDPVFPSLLAPKLNPDTGRPAADSPLIDRAEASCSAYGGGAISTSFDGVARPARATCDIGAFEVPAGTVSGGQLDLTSLNGPGLNGGALLQEGGPSATVNGIRLDTFPIVPVSFELTADAQCQLLDGGNGTPVSSITLTFNGNNWSNGRSFSVQAVNDTVGEGNHTCEVTAAYVTGSPADPLYENTAASQTIAVGLADDPADLTETPIVQFNFCEIENTVTPSANVVDCSTLSPAPTPEFLQEGELSSVGLPVRVTLAEPPTAPVRVWVTSNAPGQCQSSANTSSSLNTLTVETWDEGIVIDVYAVEDGEKEYSQSNCPVTGNWEYDASVSTPGDNTSAQTLLIEADDLTSLERSPVGDINLDEGERETVNIRTDYEIAGSAPDSYTVTLTDTLTGDLNTSECQLFDEAHWQRAASVWRAGDNYTGREQ